jgi:single-strand DNA-binding protein
MINRIVLVGRLTKDVDLRKTLSEVSVASFSLAVDDGFKDQQGNPTTTFVEVTVFDKQADNLAKFCRKGSLVGVDGRIHQRRFERKDGSKGSIIEVIANNVSFLEPKDKNAADDSGYVTDIQPPVSEESKNLDSIDVTDDDLPF